jgi:hypothetical protein
MLECERFAIRLTVRSVSAAYASISPGSRAEVGGARRSNETVEHTRQLVATAGELCAGYGSVVFQVPAAALLACPGRTPRSSLRATNDEWDFARHEEALDKRVNGACVSYIEAELVDADDATKGGGERECSAAKSSHF